jgi:hypothetical protein
MIHSVAGLFSVHLLAIAGALLVLALLSCFCGWVIVTLEIWGCDLDLSGGESANLGTSIGMFHVLVQMLHGDGILPVDKHPH